MKITYKDFFGLKIWVGITTEEKQYLREMKRFNISDPSSWLLDGAFAATHFFKPLSGNGNEKGKYICIICINPNLTRFGAYGLLVHETIHVMQWIKDIMKEDKIGNEMEAYATQGIASFLWNEYDTLKKKKK